MARLYVEAHEIHSEITEEGAVNAGDRAARGAPVGQTWLAAGIGRGWSGGDAHGTCSWPAGASPIERLLVFRRAAR